MFWMRASYGHQKLSLRMNEMSNERTLSRIAEHWSGGTQQCRSHSDGSRRCLQGICCLFQTGGHCRVTTLAASAGDAACAAATSTP